MEQIKCFHSFSFCIIEITPIWSIAQEGLTLETEIRLINWAQGAGIGQIKQSNDLNES